MTKKLIIITIILGIFWQLGFSQSTRTRVEVMFRPDELSNPTGNTSLLGPFTPGMNRAFVVWSDRTNNWTESSPGAGDKFKKLDFLDGFYVKEVKDGKANLFKGIGDTEPTPGKYFILEAVDYGWVSLEKLLLWYNAFKTENQIHMKALLMNSVEKLPEIANLNLEFETVSFYSDPNFKNKLPVGKNLFEIFYVYKFTSEAILLGTSHKSNSSLEGERNILGWVRKDQVTQWNTRLAIEPNCDPIAIEERANAGLQLVFFSDFTSAVSFRDHKIDNNAINKPLENYTKRPSANKFFRFPVHTWEKDILNVSIMEDICISEQQLNKAEEGLQSSQELERMKVSAKKVNIVFCIDGTASMESYFESVSEVIVSKVKEVSETYTDLDISAGAVIYRDELEGSRYSMETIPLSKNINEVGKKIDKIGVYNSPKNHTPHESVFMGLKRALQMFRSEDQINILFHIGDAGNYPEINKNGVKLDDIVELMVQKQCMYMAFQAGFKKETQATKDFSQQVNELMTKYGEQLLALDLFEKGVTNVELKKLGGKIEVKGPYVAIKYWWNLEAGMNDAYKCERMVQLAIAKAFELSNTTSKSITSLISGKSYVEVDSNLKKKSLERSKSFNEAWDFELTDYSTYFMKKIYDKLSPKQREFYKGSRVQTYTEGWTALRPIGLQHELYKYVVFIEERELFELKGIITRAKMAIGNDLRAEIQEFLKIMYNSVTKENRSNSYLMTMDMRFFNQVIFGLPLPSPTLGEDITFRMIMDPRAVSAGKIDAFVYRLEEIVRYLDGELSSEEFVYVKNGKRYHWVTDDIIL
jgi:hypothetical protein